MVRQSKPALGLLRYGAAAFVTTTMLACNSGGFTGANKQVEKTNAKETPKPNAPTKTAAPSPTDAGDLGNSSEGTVIPDRTPKPTKKPNDDVVVPNIPTPAPTPVPTPVPTQQPTQSPVTPQPTQQPVPTPSQEVGTLRFKAVPFINMEHQSHATEPGSFAILKSNGRVVAAGPMLPEVACRGENLESMAYPVVRLNVALSYIDGSVQSGQMSGSQSGTLSVCVASNPSAAGDALACQRLDRGNDGDRPAFWYDRPVQFTVSGTNIEVQNEAGWGSGNGVKDGFPQDQGLPQDQGFPQEGVPVEGYGLYGGSENIVGGLSFAHPIQAPICGSKARGYADYNSPIVLDLDGDGVYALTNVWEGKAVRFDVEGKGRKIRTGWVTGGDALLALDVDGDGKITSGRELFGEDSHSLTPVDKWAFSSFENGFRALAQYDDDKNGVIDAKDAVFAGLVVWRDKNGDAISTKDELVPLAAAKIASISLAYAKTGSPGHYTMVKLNEVRLESTFETTDGRTLKAGDVWFAARREEKTAAAVEGEKP